MSIVLAPGAHNSTFLRQLLSCNTYAAASQILFIVPAVHALTADGDDVAHRETVDLLFSLASQDTQGPCVWKVGIHLTTPLTSGTLTFPALPTWTKVLASSHMAQHGTNITWLPSHEHLKKDADPLAREMLANYIQYAMPIRISLS